jgi:hypothetical protein
VVGAVTVVHATRGALMPQLGGDRTALGVDGRGDRTPAGEHIVAVEVRDAVRPTGRRMRDADALGDDEPGAARGPAGVVRGDVRSRDAAG